MKSSFVGLLLYCFAGVVLAIPSLLNVSYDATRELYSEYNKAFLSYWANKTGEQLSIKQSHAGSSKQARSVIDGLEADVVTLAMAPDIQAIAEKAKLIPLNWQSRMPHDSSPYTSTIIFLVRKGNPKQIKDWDDLLKPGIAVITPNPKTSGNACWNYMAAWGYALLTQGKDEHKARSFVTNLYKNVLVLDSGARAATTTFVEREMGDVLIGWETEVLLSMKEFGRNKFDVVVPSITILAQPVVSLVDKMVDKHGTRVLSEAYLQYLYSEEGQEIAAKHYFRPIMPSVFKKYAHQFSKVKLFTLSDIAGDWHEVYKTHFSDGGVFDQIYRFSK